jgi:hypothetical protein
MSEQIRTLALQLAVPQDRETAQVRSPRPALICRERQSEKTVAAHERDRGEQSQAHSSFWARTLNLREIDFDVMIDEFAAQIVDGSDRS